jgi:hypothetical protein
MKSNTYNLGNGKIANVKQTDTGRIRVSLGCGYNTLTPAEENKARRMFFAHTKKH